MGCLQAPGAGAELVHLHMARMTSRQDGGGGLLLLEEQDRGIWDQSGIAVGLGWLARGL